MFEIKVIVYIKLEKNVKMYVLGFKNIFIM